MWFWSNGLAPTPFERSDGSRQRPPRRLRAANRRRGGAHLEWVGDRRHQPKPEDPDETHHGERTRTEPVTRPDGPGNEIGEHRQHEPPQHDAPLECRPARGEQEDERRRGRRVAGHVGDREVVAQDRRLESEHGDNAAQQHEEHGRAQCSRWFPIPADLKTGPGERHRAGEGGQHRHQADERAHDPDPALGK